MDIVTLIIVILLVAGFVLMLVKPGVRVLFDGAVFATLLYLLLG
jgi:hypothetical protein